MLFQTVAYAFKNDNLTLVSLLLLICGRHVHGWVHLYFTVTVTIHISIEQVSELAVDYLQDCVLDIFFV